MSFNSALILVTSLLPLTWALFVIDVGLGCLFELFLSFYFCDISCNLSPLSFLIVFIWVLSLFFLIRLLQGVLILFIFSKNQLLDLLILTIVLLGFMSFNSALILVISLLLPALGCLCCCSSSSCRCMVRLFI